MRPQSVWVTDSFPFQMCLLCPSNESFFFLEPMNVTKQFVVKGNRKESVFFPVHVTEDGDLFLHCRAEIPSLNTDVTINGIISVVKHPIHWPQLIEAGQKTAINETIVRNSEVNVKIDKMKNYNDKMKFCVSHDNVHDNLVVFVEIFLPTCFSVSPREVGVLETVFGKDMVKMNEINHALKIHVKMESNHTCQTFMLMKYFNVITEITELPVVFYDYGSPSKFIG